MFPIEHERLARKREVLYQLLLEIMRNPERPCIELLGLLSTIADVGHASQGAALTSNNPAASPVAIPTPNNTHRTAPAAAATHAPGQMPMHGTNTDADMPPSSHAKTNIKLPFTYIGEDTRLFIAAVNDLAPAPVRYQVACRNMSGEVYKHWLLIMQAPEHEYVPTWTSLQAYLQETYDQYSSRDGIRAREMLNTGKVVQKSSVRDYILLFRRVMVMAGNMAEEDQIMHFHAGLAPELRVECKVDAYGKPWQRIADLQRFAEGQEQRLNLMRELEEPHDTDMPACEKAEHNVNAMHTDDVHSSDYDDESDLDQPFDDPYAAHDDNGDSEY